MKKQVNGVVLVGSILIFAFALVSHAVAAPIELQFYHAMSGGRGQVLEDLVNEFNSSQNDIFVNLIFAGSYDECFSKSLSAYRSGNQPHIVMIEAAFLKTIIDSQTIYSMNELVELTGIDPGIEDILEPIYRYYAVGDTLYSLPFNSSTAILYYNKDAFRSAGLDPEIPPRTFREMEEMSRIVKQKNVQGIRHFITSSWPTWIMLENLYPYHDQAFADMDQGREGLASEIYINGDFGLEVVTTFTNWAKEGLYSYMGREYATVPTFVSGESLFLMLSTSTLGSILSTADFEVGTAFLPRMEGYPRGTSTVGGTSLGVFKGFSKEEYDAVMTFMAYLLGVEPMVKWHKGTGYFPITNASLMELLYSGWFEESPNYLTALLQLLSGRTTPNTGGPMLGNFVQLRETLDRYLEEAYTMQLTPEEAVNAAHRATSDILKEYKQIYQ